MVLRYKAGVLILFLVLAGAASVYAGQANHIQGPHGRPMLMGVGQP
jgi:hypothetical protein